MKPSKALEQLRRCALGYCDSCVHSDENCRDRIEKIINLLGARLILADSYEQLQSGEFMNKPQEWTPCSERLPERIINGDVETEQEFFVTVKERWPGEEWTYHTDLAWVPGEYIDDYWQTFNDWKEGQEVHVIAWMPLPEPYKP